MLLHEWTLVFFTVLVQAAVGIVLGGEYLLRRADNCAERKSIRRQSCIAFALFAVAGVISLGHTGSPFNSFYTILNIGSSWLSREIAVLGLTGFAFLWLAFMRWKAEEQASERIAALLVIVFGCVLIAVMSRVYRLSVVPAWDSWAGFLTFFGSVFLLGSLWHGMMSAKGDEAKKFGSALVVPAFVGLVLASAGVPLAVPTTAGCVNPSTVFIPASCIASYLSLRMVLTVLGMSTFTLSVIRTVQGSGRWACVPTLAFALALAGELLGRSMFYASYARLGM
ncbi:MAG: dimethyl sulfoxide reductase anchor subunit [Desulfovibrio sp.]|jgi:anaerobic dimethyl sulfoxide reductase subunit C (anchor subunit)|nr:dimethyl sulfoxide reductase anchor subunit [Desulfovibrio sp.]